VEISPNEKAGEIFIPRSELIPDLVRCIGDERSALLRRQVSGYDAKIGKVDDV
jgi:hypothetical protein